MTAPAAIQGTFADFKIVRGRKCAQFVIEVPLEAADAALAALGGIPTVATENWVAVARLNVGASSNGKMSVSKTEDGGSIPPAPAKRRFSELPPSQQAALKCQDADFRIWLTQSGRTVARNADDAAEFIRLLCGVDSRSDLNTNPAAAAIWQETLRDFNVWRNM